MPRKAETRQTKQLKQTIKKQTKQKKQIEYNKENKQIPPVINYIGNNKPTNTIVRTT